MTTETPPLTLRDLHHAARTSGVFWPTAMSLVFLLFGFIPSWVSGPPLNAFAVTLLSLVVGFLYLYATGVRAFPPRYGYAWIAVLWVTIGLLGLLMGADVAYFAMYILATHAVALPWRVSRWVLPVVMVLVGIAAVLTGSSSAVIFAVVGSGVALLIATNIKRRSLEKRTRRAEERSAVLAVAAERERIGRDLHDILGHSLTTITISAQLAQRLIDTDPAAAQDGVAEIERISRQSLADVRATASGLQEVRLASEIASGRSVLSAAGIEADLPVSLPALEDDRAELFGFVVREGLTNVVRHSGAHRCTIRVDESEITIHDDGRGGVPTRGRTGLAGLEQRVRDAGGELRVDSTPAGTTLTAALGSDPPVTTPTVSSAHPEVNR